MSKDKKLIPELRFPEFVNDGEWVKDIVDNLVITITPPKKLNSTHYHESGKFPIIDQSKNYYCGWTNDADAVITDNLPLIIFGDHTCIVKIATVPFAQGADGIKILKAEDNLTPEYLYQFLLYNTVKQEDYKRHFSILKENIVFYPKKENGEQQEIVSCLSSLDEIIAAHNQKLETLKLHKKGLMQYLFPQEGEIVPKWRFKEFEKDGVWRKTTIEEIAKVSAGGTPDSTNPEYWNGDIPWMNSGELNNKRISSVSNFITAKGLRESSTKLIPPKCVLIGLAGQGKTRGTAAINYIELCTNQSIASIHPNEEVFNSEFLYQKIESMYEKLRLLSAGDGGRGGLNLQIIKEIDLLLPIMEEQDKIAICLSSLDDLITSHAEELEQLKMHKKGLMQGLFPKVND
ncbi:MAG: restriction endonuclease subunit S [Ignavibacteria bacterium]|nr:restriction endonuclease subunit S [Ignavibacteria bacterium]